MPFDNYKDVNTGSGIFNGIDLDGTQINGPSIDHFSSGRTPHFEGLQKFLDRGVAGAAFNSAERSSTAPKCLPNTRAEVKQEIQQWFDAVYDPPICWLRGPPGSGKSAIAQSMAEKYEKNGKLAASFFFDRGCVNRHETAGFVSTIAYQLSIKVPQTKALMQKAFERDPSIPNQTFQYQFKKLIIDPLLELGETVSPKLVVVDGLDQYDEERWVEDLVILLNDACRDHRFPLRFCLTSRVDIPILASPEASTKRCEAYSLALEKFDAHGDIRIFFESEFKKIHRRNRIGCMRDVPEPWPSRSDVDRLVAKSYNLFIFASIIVEFVDDGSSLPHLKLQAVLASLNDRHGMTSACLYKSFIDYLVRLLNSDDIGIQAAATTGLENVTIHGGADVVVNANAIPPVVRLLESRNISVLIGACRVLVNITTNFDLARAGALSANAIPTLIRLLSFNNLRVQRPAIFALMAITLHGPAKTDAFILDAIPDFVRLLASRDTNIQASAAAVLQNIAIHGGAEGAVKAGAVLSLVNLLMSSNTVVLIAVCEALKNITLTFDIARAEALNVNGIPPLIRLLSFCDVQVQKSATFTLMNITLHEPAATAAVTLGAIPHIVHLLGSDDISIQASAAAVLENITLRDGAVVAVEANTIPSLVKLLTSSNAVVLVAACAALKNITSNFDHEALDSNIIPQLIHLLSFNDARVQKSATVVLKNITGHGPARTTALSSDAVPNLVHLLTSDDSNIQASAAAVLESITVSGGGEVAVEANAIPALVGLLLSNDFHVFIAACGALKNMVTFRCARAGIKVLKSRLSNLFFSTVDTQSHHHKTF